ncbi:fumarylacetoacetate hydrolase [Streptoalloteichus tenebrarius]|uniref:fumarylacetoacetase n=1 Tax=Streptoalloteichus tenebrarius (strain ATCC 17920 / DSM 40477 / JCM 4838 / CBS 697.72 / NBRC 16177 / NCIMB 11028 / NRRL B-12390 / A12253. 1 / ISP 5477) TaxID=1933 RepID=A0ABT1I453_STRSD|nr:fumarylacetoacetase [Streptoalloteichus tenebrarius]MCP2262572.1 fumarylacetoacetate hydrolase [Streptoalloteichus tenebrarius]BFF01836.1 fumarylacetoacetase [Streptoalloteichus tenebrarius]
MSWIDDPAFRADQPFGPQTLPYGVVDGDRDGDGGRVVAVRVGDHALPLRSVADALGARLADLVSADSLDPLLAAGRPAWTELRERLTEIVTSDRAPRGARLASLDAVTPRLPFTVADYVDFYSSRHHAENVGRIFRPDGAPLLPNWTHLPVGYHGRAGTVVVSGTDVVRPSGQSRAPGAELPSFGPSRRLDIEAEVGFVCGGPVRSRVPVSDVAEHVFGVALVNDWSARDIQAWEYQPLGPFLGKSFLTSVGAWITPLAALAEARVPVVAPEHPLVDYLVEREPWGLDLALEVRWNDTVVSRPPFAAMSWSCAQQLAHMTVNGATVRPGDLFASGTVSGADKQQRGCFLELTWGGREPVRLGSPDGTAGAVERTFLEDGDTVVITATAPGPDGSVVGLSEVAGTVRAAVS